MENENTVPLNKTRRLWHYIPEELYLLIEEECNKQEPRSSQTDFMAYIIKLGYEAHRKKKVFEQLRTGTISQFSPPEGSQRPQTRP